MRFILFLSFIFFTAFAFSQSAPNKYWVKLKDKENNQYSIDNPQEFLSQRAIERRDRYNIAIEENDLPLTQQYVDSIRSLGAKILLQSKWMNAITIETTDNTVLTNINNLSFVDSIEIFAKSKSNKTEKPIEKSIDTYYDYGYALEQIEIHNGQYLHNMGYRGQGMYIAIIDAGFVNVDILDEFKSLFENNQIIATKDFVDGDDYPYEASTHGEMVLSTIAVNLSGKMVGTAPEASFILLRSEDVASEYKIEEDNWISAAEFADSIGVDVINTSLGYSTFDNSSQNYTYSDMDGKTSRISQGADICSSKGIAVVVSAGNEGASSWYYITSPGDAESVLTIGAVSTSGTIASFSSRGPSADGRIKPDVVAVGQNSTVISSTGSVYTASGTSFSAPITTGLVACLWQVNKNLTNNELFKIIKESSSQYFAPDNNYGYGIPDFSEAYSKIIGEITSENVFLTSKNPFEDKIEFTIETINATEINITFSDILGRTIFTDTKNIEEETINQFVINDLLRLSSGMYVLKISNLNKKYQFKLIKE